MLRLAKTAQTAVAARRTFSTSAPRVFASYGVYKPDRFEVTAIPPTFRALNGGAFAAKGPGCILFAIAPHDGSTVEWSRKANFALSPSEAAEIIDVHASVCLLACTRAPAFPVSNGGCFGGGLQGSS